MPLSAAEKVQLDRAFDRLLRLAGLPNGLPFRLSESPAGGLETAEDATLWVDANTGSDSNNGSTAQTPLKTIGAALDKARFQLLHKATIRVKAGTYAENLLVSKFSVPTTSGMLTIQGEDWIDSTLASGAQTGAVASQADTVVTVTGAGWTANDLRGKFLLMTSGSRNGSAFPIAGNTTDTLELCTTLSMGAGSTFRIVEPGAVIAPATGSAFVVHMIGAGFSLRLLNLKTSCATNMTAISLWNGSIWLDRCLLTGNSFRHISLNSLNATCYFGHSAIMHQATTDGEGILHNGASLSIDSSLIDGGGFTGGAANYGIFADKGLFVHIETGASVFQRWKQTNSIGILFNDGNTHSKCNRFTVRDCYQGLLLGANCMMELDDARIQDCTSHGVQVGGIFGGCSSLDASGKITITGCGGDGLRLLSSGNWVNLGGSSVIQNNTAWGVSMAPNKSTAHGHVYLSGGTMSGNTSGDFTVDGTTAVSLADLQADPDKVIVDSLRFNRLVHE